MRPVFQWNLGLRSLELGKRTLIMGVLNVTPDSFSDGGLYRDRDKAVEHALFMLDQGADIVDVGGESTRPGVRVTDLREKAPEKKGGIEAKSKVDKGSEKSGSEKVAVSEKEELERVIPVIEGIRKKKPGALISVDTYKSAVARAAVQAGAQIVNDVSGLRWDPEMPNTLAGLNCGVIMMHMRGLPQEWRNLPAIADMVLLVKRELSDWTQDAVRLGIKRDRIAVDPGLGFGKNFEQNYPLLKRLEELHTLRFPLVVGVSRKSFVGRAIANNGKDAPSGERLFGTLAAETIAVVRGAHILRTHDVKASADAARMADRVA
jgi:dihydropteroate synthase